MTAFMVPDASLVMKWYLPEPMSDEAISWLKTAARQEIRLVAPDLLLYELGNALWKHVRAGVLGSDEAAFILEHVTHSPIQMVDAAVVAVDALRIAWLCHVTVYDASYVALASALNTQVVTADERLVRALASTPFRGRAVALTSL